MRAKSSTQVSATHTKAWQSFERNLDDVVHITALAARELAIIKAASTRARTSLEKAIAAKQAAKVTYSRSMRKHLRSIGDYLDTLGTGLDRLAVARLWQSVMLVTCVEAYLQDVLSSAANIDPMLMSMSEQLAPYADVVDATSIEELAKALRSRWSRAWVNDGGPTRWIERLGRMGAKGYADDLGPWLERIWGIRHVVVHAAGVATADFIKRHPNVPVAPGPGVKKGQPIKLGDRIFVSVPDFQAFVNAIRQFIESTEAYFLARYPTLAVPAEQQSKQKIADSG